MTYLKKFVGSKSLNSIQNSDHQDQKSVVVFVLSWKLISLLYLRIHVLPMYYCLAKNVPFAFCTHSPLVDCNIFPKTLMGNPVFLKAIDYCCITFFWLIALQRFVNLKGHRFRTQSLNHAKLFLEILFMTMPVSWSSFMTKRFTVQKVYSEMYFSVVDSVVARENTVQRKPIFWHILHNVNRLSEAHMIVAQVINGLNL